MSKNTPLVEVIREAMKPRLLRRVPLGEPNGGAEQWEQPGAEEIAAALLALPVEQRMEAMGMQREAWACDLPHRDLDDVRPLWVEAPDAR